MAIVQSAKHVETVIPSSQAELPNPRTYFINTPTRQRRAAFRRAITSAGIFVHPIGEIVDAVRGVIDLVQPSEADSLLALCDRVAADNGLNMDAIDGKNWSELAQSIGKVSPDVARMLADNNYYNAMAPLVAASFFLTGWENLPFAFRRGLDGLVPGDLLEQIEDGDLAEIWLKILVLMAPSRADEKNSASPALSPTSQAPTVSAEEPLNSPQTAAPGSSSASDTSATQS
jgi:hypothetical protein